MNVVLRDIKFHTSVLATPQFYAVRLESSCIRESLVSKTHYLKKIKVCHRI
jgi:hypothetical protein